jgi:hypothetical protein
MYAKAVSVSCHYSGETGHVLSSYSIFTHKSLFKNERFLLGDADWIAALCFSIWRWLLVSLCSPWETINVDWQCTQVTRSALTDFVNGIVYSCILNSRFHILALTHFSWNVTQGHTHTENPEPFDLRWDHGAPLHRNRAIITYLWFMCFVFSRLW